MKNLPSSRQRTLTSLAAREVYRSIAKLIGDDAKASVARVVGESPQSFSEVLNGHRGTLDRVVGWLDAWNRRVGAQRRTEMLVMTILGNDTVRVLPLETPHHFKLRPSGRGGTWRLWVRVAPGECWVVSEGDFHSADVADLPDEALMQAWSSANVGKTLDLETVASRLSLIDWEDRPSRSGRVELSGPPMAEPRRWDGQWVLSYGQNVLAIKVEASLDEQEMSRQSSDFMLHIDQVTLETRFAMIVRTDPASMVVVVRPAPAAHVLLPALADWRGATVFNLNPQGGVVRRWTMNSNLNYYVKTGETEEQLDLLLRYREPDGSISRVGRFHLNLPDLVRRGVVTRRGDVFDVKVVRRAGDYYLGVRASPQLELSQLCAE